MLAFRPGLFGIGRKFGEPIPVQSPNSGALGNSTKDGRQAGSFQPDEVIRHNHLNGNHRKLIETHPQGKGTTRGADGTVGEPNLERDGVKDILPYGGDETRPVNIAVYYYIKIN